MSLFLPRQEIFFDHLKGMSDRVKEMVALLVEFGERFDQAESFAKRAKDLEHQADQKTHEITDWLNKTFITPLDREDIYLLVHELDDIVDLIENVIKSIHLYQIKQKFDGLAEFIWTIEQASGYLEQLLDHLHEPSYTPKLKQAIIRLHELEDRGDMTFYKSISNLLNHPQDPVLVIKLKDVLEDLENVMDKFQKVSDIIDGIIVKSS